MHVWIVLIPESMIYEMKIPVPDIGYFPKSSWLVRPQNPLSTKSFMGYGYYH